MNDKITGQEIADIVRQSNSYYIYLTNGVRILAMKFGSKIWMTPPKWAGNMIKYQSKNVPTAIRQYIKDYNLKGEF